MLSTVRTLPPEERDSVLVPEYFVIGGWPDFLPIWVLDVYAGVCRAAALHLRGESQDNAIQWGVYHAEVTSVVQQRAIHRLRRSSIQVPSDIDGSLSLLESLGLVVRSGALWDVPVRPRTPEAKLNLPFWYRRQMMLLRYYKTDVKVLQELGHTASKSRLSVSPDDLQEIMGVQETGWLRFVLNKARSQRLIEWKYLDHQDRIEIVFLPDRIANDAVSLEQDQLLRWLKNKGAGHNVVETSVQEITDQTGQPPDKVREILMSLFNRDLLFLEEPLDITEDTDAMFIELP